MTELARNQEQLPYPDKLIQYDDGMVDAAWTTPGITVNLVELRDMATNDPMLRDLVQSPEGIDDDSKYVHGTFVVQTAEGQRIIFDSRHMSDNHTDRNRLIALGETDITAIAPITIGETWDSPLGMTAPVTALAMPWTRRIIGAEQRPGRANTLQGADWIKQARANNGR